jgi:hypothetical protein
MPGSREPVADRACPLSAGLARCVPALAGQQSPIEIFLCAVIAQARKQALSHDRNLKFWEFVIASPADASDTLLLR